MRLRGAAGQSPATPFLYSDQPLSPARRAARGGRAPGTPGQGLRPLEP